MPPVLAAERLRNARRINAFRLVGLLTSLALEGFFTVTVPGWIRAPLPLFAGWTVIAAALFVGGLRSEPRGPAVSPSRSSTCRCSSSLSRTSSTRCGPPGSARTPRQIGHVYTHGVTIRRHRWLLL
jgi:hypothetical protein